MANKMGVSERSDISYTIIQPTTEVPPAAFIQWYSHQRQSPEQAGLASSNENTCLYYAIDPRQSNTSNQNPSEWMTMTHVPTISTGSDRIIPKSDNTSIKNQAVNIKTSLFELVQLWEADGKDHDNELVVAVALTVTLKPDRKGDELRGWYNEEHMPLISKVPGWRRTRLFRRVFKESEGRDDFLTFHEYAPENGLNGPEFKAAVGTPRAKDMQFDAPETLTRQLYHSYVA